MLKADIEYEGRDLEIEFDYQPEEKEVRYYSDGSGYPGCPEEYTIYSVKLNGREVIKHVNLERIEELLIEKREAYED